MYADTQIFVSVLEQYFAKYHFTASTIVNADETRLSIKGNIFCTEYLESTQKTKFTHKMKKTGKTAGLLVFATTAGKVLLSVYLIPVEFNKEDEGTGNTPVYKKAYTLRGDWRRCYLFTEKGYVTDEAWEVIMEEYMKVAKNEWRDIDNLLLLDRLGSHMQGPIIKRFVTTLSTSINR